jgi:hypothetical protein
MKRIIFVLIFLLILILILVGIFKYNRNFKITESQSGTKNISNKKSDGNIFVDNSFEINWKEIGIRPVSTIEGINYTFTAFDIFDNSVIAIAGSFPKYLVRFFDLNKRILIDSVELNDMPLEVFFFNELLYVLTPQTVYSIKNFKILESYSLSDENIFLFDKFLEINSHFSLLMSDGTSYYFEEGKFKLRENLIIGNNAIWVLKTSNTSFSINNELNNSLYIYNNDCELGSITIAGGKNNIYCCIDKMFSNNPPHAERIISSSNTQFEKELVRLPIKDYSYIKNDYRIHKEIIYYLKVDSSKLEIIRKKL